MGGQQCKMSLKFNSEEWALQFSLNSCSNIALTSFVVFFHPPAPLSCHNHTPRPALHHLKATEEKPLPASSCQGAISHMSDFFSVDTVQVAIWEI